MTLATQILAGLWIALFHDILSFNYKISNEMSYCEPIAKNLLPFVQNLQSSVPACFHSLLGHLIPFF